ncbi:hypothetical protein Ga0100231_012975 [Opitutaceae bacterium TAV4]|nr:hypothetical protein Ga0100231_012975 [Opitutaceae bacterium TAV4]RRJ99343.1 hypothetical protein Ga0100230_014270 [Opitutaceae bacterium TAV3]
MKLAILSESPADEAALAVLIEAALGRTFQRIHPPLRARGWPSVAQVLPSIIKHLHFNTDAHGLVVVVDSDDSVVHTPLHDEPGHHHPGCRLCQLRATFRQTTKKLSLRPTRPAGVLRGIGVAVPAIEAWYLCGRDATVTEAAWRQGQETARPPYTRRELKSRVYGTERPSLPLETERALADARRHARDLRRLEHDFPGFQSLSRDLRDWQARLA